MVKLEQRSSLWWQNRSTHWHSCGGGAALSVLGAFCASRQCGAVWAVMKDPGPLLLSCFSLLISCLLYHSLSHKTNNTEDVCGSNHRVCVGVGSLAFSTSLRPDPDFFFFCCVFVLFCSLFLLFQSFWFSSLFTVFLLLDDFPPSCCTCSHSTSCCHILPSISIQPGRSA